MSSKVFNSGNDAKFEAEWNELNLSESIFDSDIIVNPDNKINNYIGKTIVITLPKSKLDRLLGAKIISRIKLNGDLKYEYVPYEEPKVKQNIERKTYSRRILNPYLLKSKEEINDDDFLLGTNLISGDDLTQVGFIILKTINS